MARRKINVLVFTLTLLCTGCIEDTAVIPGNTINADSVKDYDIAAANNAFAFDMYSQLAQLEPEEKKNVLFSPHSISAAMAICYEGAENTTKEQISNVFYFPSNKTVLKVRLERTNDKINSVNNDYELQTANALWVQERYPIKEAYISNVKKYYDGEVTNLDFVRKSDDSRDTINEWVEARTKNKIKDLVPEDSITANTRVIITNAIYFNGKWVYEFDKELTDKKTFYPANGEEISVDMMYMYSALNYGENSKAKIIELPYKGNDLSMYIVLPKDNDIEEFETDFTINDYAKLKNDMDSGEDVETSIPKFKFETKTELSDSLVEMGVVDAFNLNRANFSGISDSPLAISRVIHQAFIDVQEEGTEAAAATMVEMDMGMRISWDSKPREFKADHPFMFFIEDKRTGCILFMGKVEYPEYEETKEF
ncbi:serpin [Methanosarcina sp. 2.H.T.1A.6]|uniref:serpin family protein n=1 Tax=unclassified Methanosarcina TaxID=2644672 RepID=UPI000620FEC3|nr:MULTISPECIES: serpin family protein [unclassified Methanosarcina]KKG17003.1 serpin [Methanosarcina sp. 2.H.T.1A.3]KKG20373.1 serpin [Methanosarcina sp. 2.H.T.1A.6]KKG23362.1 serpin [Methanosarcina sp. 2.H.T.1A.8]KKG27746.1 serpin [Methanosarcina sp. 2.H.T.1A.15]